MINVTARSRHCEVKYKFKIIYIQHIRNTLNNILLFKTTNVAFVCYSAGY
jgi:hypothetical protein